MNVDALNEVFGVMLAGAAVMLVGGLATIWINRFPRHRR